MREADSEKQIDRYLGQPAWATAATVLAQLSAVQRPWHEASRLLHHPVWRGRGVPDGGGRPVLLIPGVMAGDPSLSMMRRWLRRTNYWTCTSQIRFNADCPQLAVKRLERRLVEFTDRMGRPAAIIGQSRGGTLAKLIAMRRPDLVSGIVALGSPNVDPAAVNPMLARHVRLVTTLGAAGIPGLFREECVHGACADEVREWLSQPFPSDVPYLSVYSRSDWVVDWRACVDPDAENVEVDSSHIGMSANPDVYEIVGARLATFVEYATRRFAESR